MKAALVALAVAAALSIGGGPSQPVVVAVHVAPREVATGVATGPGRVLTVAHVLDGASPTVRTTDGRVLRARVERIDRRLDLAVLAVPGLRAPHLRTGRAGASARLLLRRGDVVQSVPIGVRRHITAHLVDQPGSPRRPALEISAEIGHGDSGAPVLTPDGRLAGIVYARSESRSRTAYAVSCAAGGCH